MLSLTSPIDTPYHALRAGTKLGFLCLFTAILFAVSHAAMPIGGFALTLALYAAAGYRFLLAGAARLRPLLPFLLVVLAWHLITGSPVEGAAISLKMIAAVGLANLVTMTTRLDDMMAAAERFFSPARHAGLPPRVPALAIALVIRFAPVLIARGQILAESWKCRSPRRPGWRILAPFAALALDDAERVAEALRARGGI